MTFHQFQHVWFRNKYARSIVVEPYKWLNCKLASEELDTPLKVYAFAEANLRRDRKPSEFTELRTPEECLQSRMANDREFVLFCAHILHLAKHRVNIYSIAEDARRAEDEPVHFFCVVRVSATKYASLSREGYLLHRVDPRAVIEDYPIDGKVSPCLIYERTGEDILFSFIPNARDPWRLGDDYEPHKDLA